MNRKPFLKTKSTNILSLFSSYSILSTEPRGISTLTLNRSGLPRGVSLSAIFLHVFPVWAKFGFDHDRHLQLINRFHNLFELKDKLINFFWFDFEHQFVMHSQQHSAIS